MDYRCSSGKLQYESEGKAKAAVTGRQSRKGKLKTSGRHGYFKLGAYKCSICNLWHLGGTSK